jgi:hypothetical protein
MIQLMSALATYGRTVIDVDDGDGDGGRVWTAFMMMRRTRGCGSLSSAAPRVRVLKTCLESWRGGGGLAWEFVGCFVVRKKDKKLTERYMQA